MTDAIAFLSNIPFERDLSIAQLQDVGNIRRMYTILDTTDVYSLTIPERSVFRTIAQSDIGSSSGIARSVLSYYGENHPLPYYVGDAGSRPIRFRSDTEEDFEKTDPHSSVIKIWPNPSRDHILIDIGDPGSTGSGSTVSVINLVGQVVFSNPFVSGETAVHVDVSSWVSGPYVVFVRDTEGRYRSKMFFVY